MPAGRIAGPGPYWISAGVRSLLFIVWIMKHSFQVEEARPCLED
jgi:hypothetical protein